MTKTLAEPIKHAHTSVRKYIMKTLNCSIEKAVKIEGAIDISGAVNWSRDSKRLIKGIVKGINEWDEFKNMN